MVVNVSANNKQSFIYSFIFHTVRAASYLLAPSTDLYHVANTLIKTLATKYLSYLDFTCVLPYKCHFVALHLFGRYSFYLLYTL